jgi:hypothetical protein
MIVIPIIEMNMDLILLHVSEFYSWTATSYLRMDVGRVLTINVDSNESVQTLFDSYGHILISEPESYIVASLTADWRHSLLRPVRTTTGSVSIFPLEVVEDFHALTDDARLRLGSQAERLCVVLGETKFEQFWRKYQLSEKLAQDQSAGRLFTNLFNFPSSSDFKLSGMHLLRDERLNELLTRITDYKEEQRLQTVKNTAEYGLYEFGIRLANSFPKEWRSNDIGYARFREVRSRYLQAKSWDSISYLDYPEVVASLDALEDISKETIGVDPFAGACFFLQRVKYELSGKRSIDFSSLKSDAKKLISLGKPESCLLFLYIFGCNLGLETVSKIRYHLNSEKFPTIKSDSINRNFNDLNVDAFDLTSLCMGDDTNQTQVLDHGVVEAASPIGIVPCLVLSGSAESTSIEIVGQIEDVKPQTANAGMDQEISTPSSLPVSDQEKVEVVEPGLTDVAAAELVLESTQTSIATPSVAEAETPAQTSFLKSDEELSAGEKTANAKDKKKSGTKSAKKRVPKSA